MTDVLAALESELARLPGVLFTRFVDRGPEGGLGATMYVSAGSDLGAVLRNADAVARVHFGAGFDASRVVFAEVGELRMVAPDRAVATAASSPAGVAPGPPLVPTSGGTATAAGKGGAEDRDAHEALEAAQQAVAEMLERLHSDTHEERGTSAPA